jgi:hypothetical protein
VAGGRPLVAGRGSTRDVIKDDIGGKLPSGRPFRLDVRARPRLSRGRGFPADGFLPSAEVVKTASVRTLGCVRADAAQRPRGHSCGSAPTRKKIKNKKFILFLFFIFKFFLVVVAGFERENFFSIFGFQSPKSPNSPSSAGFAGKAARRRRFFRPSSPSHPSKLYSSLGWLNSKVPKPFPPFSLRLIDVDGF